ncbi:hypothetical protein B0T25DRAFT_176438 [Lasiosphaeria hispida]|uniref:Uncharacterized protein n=1 Tax=Lasiosphaeria hispida TaxID=260671 RepID=A0AAJ0HNM5_9PEZI|nr:hypothetical protein B0T25DRAFT_176438 [Lasiosphaeria hispida]
MYCSADRPRMLTAFGRTPAKPSIMLQAPEVNKKSVEDSQMVGAVIVAIASNCSQSLDLMLSARAMAEDEGDTMVVEPLPDLTTASQTQEQWLSNDPVPPLPPSDGIPPFPKVPLSNPLSKNLLPSRHPLAEIWLRLRLHNQLNRLRATLRRTPRWRQSPEEEAPQRNRIAVAVARTRGYPRNARPGFITTATETPIHCRDDYRHHGVLEGL